jgi:hypothetical protein
MPRKTRRINSRRIKRDYSYTFQELADCTGVHKSTVRNWRKKGMPVIDDKRPHLVHGSDAIDFLNKMQAKRKCKCAVNELYCLKCRCPRKAVPGSVRFISLTTTKLNISGKCEECNTAMFKAGSEAKRSEYVKTFGIERQAGEHIIDTAIPTLNCHLRKDDIHA